MSARDFLWPSEGALGSVLGSDAHTLDAIVFLAVHQPMRFRRVNYGRTVDEAPSAGERDLLDALLAESGEGRVIVPIGGPSGSGKSHAIRWLEAELTSREDADTRHVILVPKSSSLKSVLRRIVRDLHGPRYNKIRKSLEGASDSLPEVAARDLRTRLISLLKSESAEATERIRNRSTTDRAADQQAEWGRELADLLDDPELWSNHFYRGEANPGVVARLAQRITSEGSADRTFQFVAEDFDRLVSVVEIGHLSRAAREPIKRLNDPKYRQLAANILNSVLDEATQKLLDLGNTPLSEVFLELRRALLVDGKELVILVEDFAVLSGMQGALLDALIHEARVHGRKEYCTIRSALAYTTGYTGYKVMERETVQTRAGAGWHIDDAADDREILDRAVQLIGAYWNAARWGIVDLKKQKEQAASLHGWVSPCEPRDASDEESRLVEAFGRSRAGYPLFPLNEAAIRQLVRENCVVHDKIVFNPRLIIDRIVFGVAKLRQHFVSKAFPPQSLGEARLTAGDIIAVINRQPANQIARLLTLLAYWADLPDSLAEAARLPAAAYEAFDLAPIDFGAPAPSVQPQIDVRAPTRSVVSVDPLDEKWKSTLDAWQRGKRLEQGHARDLRTWIVDAVVDTLAPDWPGSRLCIDKSKLAKDYVYLPNAHGGAGLDAADAAISLCDDDAWSDASRAGPLRQSLEAIIRFHGIKETKTTWNYVGGEKQSIHYSNFVAGRRGTFMDWMSKRREQQRDFSLTHLVEARLIAGSVLGVGVKGGNQLDSAIDVLFREFPVVETPSHGLRQSPWQKLLSEARQHGDWCRTDLIERVGVRQGRIGAKLLAVDVASIERPVREFLKKWVLSDGPKEQSAFALTVQRGVEARQVEVNDWLTKNREWLGDSLDKQTLIDQSRELLTEAKQLGLAREEEIEKVRALLSQFRDASVAESLANAKVAVRSPVDGTTLPALAEHDSKTAQVVDELGEELEQIFGTIENSTRSKLEAASASVVKQMIEQVAGELRSLQTLVADYTKGGFHEGH